MVAAQGLGAGSDVSLGGLRAEAQADDAPGNALGQVQGGHYMAGLALMAGGAGGDADALAAQVVDDVLAGPPRQGHRQNVRGGAAADDLKVRDGGKLLRRVGLDLGYVGELLRKIILPQLHGLGKACNLSGGLRTGPETGLLAAAGKQGLGIFHPGTDVQRADALGAADLVGGDGDEVRSQALGGKGDFQKALDGVGVQQCLGIAGREPCGDLGDGVDVAQFVVDHHAGDHRRVRPDGGENLLRRDVTIGVGGHIGHFVALALQPAAALDDGAVLHSGGDDMAAYPAVLPTGGGDGPVVCLCAAGGEKQRLGVAANRLGDDGAPGAHPALHLQAHGILGTGIAELLGEHLIHGVRHFTGYGGGGGVIQIDHGKRLLSLGVAQQGKNRYNKKDLKGQKAARRGMAHPAVLSLYKQFTKRRKNISL